MRRTLHVSEHTTVCAMNAALRRLAKNVHRVSTALPQLIVTSEVLTDDCDHVSLAIDGSSRIPRNLPRKKQKRSRFSTPTTSVATRGELCNPIMATKRRRTANCDFTESPTKRRSSEAFRGHADSTDEVPRTWLDLLPAEICTQISAAVAKGRPSLHALHLAQASPQQGKAIAATLCHAYSLHFHRSKQELALAWMSIFMRDVRKVYITPRFAKLSSKQQSNALSLLSMPTLRTARVPDNPRVLRAVSKAATVQELSILLLEDGPFAMDATRLLMRCLGALRLRKLVLECCTPWNSECPFRRLERLQDSRYALSRCCPDLTAFQIDCWVHLGDPQLAIWSPLSSLREVTITAVPPDDVISRLRTVQSVRITDLPDGVQLARRLGSSVTHVRISDGPTAAGEIAALSVCERMSEMELVIEQGSETSVLKAVCSMPSLRSLVLCWYQQNMRQFRAVNLSGWVRRFFLPSYMEATDGMMLRVAQQTRTLTHLDLLEVRIRATEIVAILKQLGSGLKHFGVSFCDQHESSFDRFAMIVETIIEHNRRLCTVSAGRERMCSFLRIDLIDESDLTGKQARQLKNRKNKLFVWLRRLKNYVPSLDQKSVDSWIRAVQWI